MTYSAVIHMFHIFILERTKPDIYPNSPSKNTQIGKMAGPVDETFATQIWGLECKSLPST